MQPILINAGDVTELASRLWWPSLRIGGFVLTAPIASENTIPRRIKVLLTLALASIVAPLVPAPSLSIFSGAGVWAAAQELLTGVAIGLIMQLAFEALHFAGQTIAATMGLGFATLIDPQRGVSVPVLGQLFMIMGMLTYLSIDGHLILLGALVHSFQSLPIGAANVDRNLLLSVAARGAYLFETGLSVALPVVIALVIVNMALGVVTRAAPQLNLFGIGFTITLLAGFFVLMVSLDGIMAGISKLVEGALTVVQDLAGSPAAGVL